MSNKRAIVTGGAGFIGSHLVEALVVDGWRVTVLDDLSTGRLENLEAVKDQITFIECSITEECIDEHFQESSVVFHLAAEVSVPRSIEEPMRAHTVNVHGFLKVLEAMRLHNVKQMVLVSSAAVYGSNAPIPVVESLPYAPESPYGLHKVISEQYARMYRLLYGIESVILRPFNVYGPRQRADSPYSGVVAQFATLARNGLQPVIFGDGSYTRDFVSVHDAVWALMLAARYSSQTNPVYHVFNMGTGKATTIEQLAQTIYASAGIDCEPEYQPVRGGDIRESVADIRRITQELQWKPEWSLEEGIEELMSI